MKSLFILLLSFIFNTTFSQTLPTSRSTDWTIAGLRDTTAAQTIVFFSGDNTGVTDNSGSLITLLASLSVPTIIQFEQGIFLFNAEIALPSNVVIRGKGAGKTTLRFDLGGATEGCFTATGIEPSTIYVLTANASKEDFIISLANTSAFAVGDYVRFQKDDQALLNDSWAYNHTGQISRIASLTATTLTLESPLRMDYLLTENVRLKKVIPKENIGIECLTLHRVDQVNSIADRNKISKIKFNKVVNSWVKGLESINCNYAHVEALYSADLLVSECYFHDAFDFGDGGRAYGVMLHFATSESRVENSIFKTLRHAMILQAGANGNVFAYNFSDDAKKPFFGGTIQSEDLVCHGNYPYLNLFEGNSVESPSVDNSHGANGPFNTFFRNRSRSNAFNVSASSSSNQNFLGNEGSKSLAGSGHFEVLNLWNGTSGTLENLLAYNTSPPFLTAAQFVGIGYGYFGVSAQIPASTRYSTASFILESCGFSSINIAETSSVKPKCNARIVLAATELILFFNTENNARSAFILMNANGTRVAEDRNFEAKGGVHFPLPNLAHGVYILRLKEDSVWKSLKVVL